MHRTTRGRESSVSLVFQRYADTIFELAILTSINQVEIICKLLYLESKRSKAWKEIKNDTKSVGKLLIRIIKID